MVLSTTFIDERCSLIISTLFESAMFRWFSSSNNDNSNFLKVANTFTSRRLSDNTLMTPKIRVAPSCESSPGVTPGDGLPIRRHSSTGPQDRRGSNINLSPPLVSYLCHPIVYPVILFSFGSLFQLGKDKKKYIKRNKPTTNKLTVYSKK